MAEPNDRNLIDGDVPEIAASTAWARKIAKRKFMLLEKKGPQVFLSLRHYFIDKLTGRSSDRPREIKLSKLQTNDLLHCLDNTKSALMNALDEGATCQALYDSDGKIDDDIDLVNTAQNYSVHIGENTFVRIESGNKYVDIRSFYFGRNKNLYPTPRGITLFKDEFLTFYQKIKELNDLWKDLDVMNNCRSSHDNEDAHKQCQHCSPKCPY